MPIPKNPTNRYNLVRAIRHTGDRECGVYVVKKEADGRMYVKKTAFGEESVASICREYRALRVLDHPNIIKMVESFANMDTMMGAIIVEYHMGGDLSQYIKDTQRCPDPGVEAAKNVFKDMAAALAYCHYGIRAPDSPLPNWDAVIHKDIRLENIFLRPDNNAPGGLTSILGDLGSSTNEAAEAQLRRRPRGTIRPGADPDWLPPEAPRLTAKSDVWGLATVMACVCQHVTQPRELRKTLGDYHVGGDDGRSHYEIHARYGRRFGEIVREMEREDEGRRWDSRKVFQEVDVGVVYTPWQGGDEEFVAFPR